MKKSNQKRHAAKVVPQSGRPPKFDDGNLEARTVPFKRSQLVWLNTYAATATRTQPIQGVKVGVNDLIRQAIDEFIVRRIDDQRHTEETQEVIHAVKA